MERILDAAVELVEEQGADALSMRSLAQRLGSGTATLYRHFAGRKDLVAMVVDRLFGETGLDAEDLAALPWQQACTTLAQSMFDVLARYGHVAPLLIGHVPMGPNAMAQRELCLSILLDNGFEPAVAARTYATLSRYVLGFVIQLPGHTQAPTDQSPAGRDDEELSAAFHRLDPSRYPATLVVADDLPVALAEEFTFGLRLIVAGLERSRPHLAARG